MEVMIGLGAACLLIRLGLALYHSGLIRAKNAAAWTLAAELAPYLSTACRAAAAAPYPINRYAAPVG